MEEQLASNSFFELFIKEATVVLPSEKVEMWVGVFENYFLTNNILVYNDLTEAIFNGTIENLEIIQENWSRIMEFHTQWNLALDSNLNEKFKKVQDHILLAITQRKFILDNIEVLKTELNQKTEELQSLTQELEVAKKTVDNLKDIKTRIYTEFVSILGIFTAVVLGAFGSLQVIGSVFNHIKDVSTGKLLVFSSLTSIGVLILLFLLMRWINQIVRRDSDNLWEYNFKENIFFLMSLFVLLYMLVVGFLLYNEEPKNSIFKLFSDGQLGIIVFIIITIITIVVLLLGAITIVKKQK
ncbi:hypothetical protein [Peribacillus butanolivorans]